MRNLVTRTLQEIGLISRNRWNGKNKKREQSCICSLSSKVTLVAKTDGLASISFDQKSDLTVAGQRRTPCPAGLEGR